MMVFRGDLDRYLYSSVFGIDGFLGGGDLDPEVLSMGMGLDMCRDGEVFEVFSGVGVNVEGDLVVCCQVVVFRDVWSRDRCLGDGVIVFDDGI